MENQPMNLHERAEVFTQLVSQPGWELLQRSFRPEIRTRITDQDSKETFLYEAVRAQVIQEIFNTPGIVIKQASHEWARSNAGELKIDPAGFTD